MNGLYLVTGEHNEHSHGEKNHPIIKELAYNFGNRSGLLSREIANQEEFVNSSIIRVDQKGKPYFDSSNFDGPKPDIHFSISHSGKYLAILFSDQPCGVDVQEIRTVNREKISKRFFDEREWEYVANNDQDAFFDIWTRREAVGKMMGEGFFGDIPALVSEGELASKTIWQGKDYYIQEVKLDGEYKCAICTALDNYYIEFVEPNKPKVDYRGIAARYLGRSAKSVRELRNHLKKKGAEDTEIETIITEFLELGYLNDREYASQFMRYGTNKGWGRKRILSELRKRGVSKEDIEFEETENGDEIYESEKNRAFRVAEKIVEDNDFDDSGRLNEKIKARVARRLYSYGYSSDVIYGTINRLESEYQEDLMQ